jgi:nitroreductase
MEAAMHSTLNAIFQRRAIRLFDPIEISPALRDELLGAARLAPSSFNSQPYRLFWVSSRESLRTVAQLFQPAARGNRIRSRRRRR